jgi:hypothetical protein
MRFRLIFLGLVLTAFGCGGGPRIVPVSGQVTLDGQPLADAQVVFRPDSTELNPGPASHGKTDAEGRFVLRTMDDHDGAVVGPHKVRVSVVVNNPSGDKDAPPTEKLPARYSGEGSILRFTVPKDGTKDAHIDLRPHARDGSR